MTASATPPADAAAGAPKYKVYPIVRWGNLIFFIVAFLLFAFVGAGPVTKWAVQKYGTQALGSEVKLDSASLDLFHMSMTLKGFRQADPADATKNTFEAAEIRAKLDPIATLKGQIVIDEAVVVKPKGRLVRNADGTINAPPEPPPPGTDPNDPTWKKKVEEMARKRDLVEDVKSLMKKWKERKEAAETAKKEEEARREKLGIKDYDGRADYVRGPRPLIVVRTLRAEGVEMVLEDQSAKAPPQTIQDGTLEVKELSSAPRLHDKPMEMHFGGKLAGGKDASVKLDGTVDMRSDSSKTSVLADLADIPLDALDAYFQGTIPVKFVGSTLASLKLPLDFEGYDIDWRPAILLDQIQAVARQPGSKIAGFDAGKVAEELTNAGKIAIQSIRIHGPIFAPQIEGDVEAVKQLVLEGGKAFAKKQSQAALDKGQKAAEEEAQKLLDKNPGAKKALEGTPAEGVLKGGTQGAGDAAKGALDGFLGGSKKDKK